LGQVPQLKCYKTACQSATSLKILIEDIWYECPYDGGNIKPAGYGGILQCLPQAADRICLGLKEDEDWPKFHTTLPRRGGPGTVITVYGENFLKGGDLSINITYPLLNVSVISNFELTAVLPQIAYDSFDIFSFYSRKHPIVIRNAKGKSVIKTNYFVYTTGFISEVQSEGRDLIDNKMGVVYVIFGAVVLVSVVIYIIKRKFPKRPKNENDQNDQFNSENIGINDNSHI